MDKEQLAGLLDLAARLCVEKHYGQRDKGGSAYFQHPMRVAMRCQKDEEKMVALLHDILEDTDVTAEDLIGYGFPENVVEGILSVTKMEGESYGEFVERAKSNPLGRVVKIHDLEDNMDILRLGELDEKSMKRLNKYLCAYRRLLT